MLEKQGEGNETGERSHPVRLRDIPLRLYATRSGLFVLTRFGTFKHDDGSTSIGP